VLPGSKFKTFNGHSSHVTNVCFSANDTHVLSIGGNDRSIFMWKLLGSSGKVVESTEETTEGSGSTLISDEIILLKKPEELEDLKSLQNELTELQSKLLSKVNELNHTQQLVKDLQQQITQLKAKQTTSTGVVQSVTPSESNSVSSGGVVQKIEFESKAIQTLIQEVELNILKQLGNFTKNTPTQTEEVETNNNSEEKGEKEVTKAVKPKTEAPKTLNKPKPQTTQTKSPTPKTDPKTKPSGSSPSTKTKPKTTKP